MSESADNKINGSKIDNGNHTVSGSGSSHTYNSGIFISTFQKDIDKKGRVVVPAEFRNVLINSANKNNQHNIPSYGFVAFRSYTDNAIECFSMERMEKLSAQVDDLDPFSTQRDEITSSVFADSHFISFDPNDGRAKIPQFLLDYAGISDSMCFVGKGATFQIWNTQDFIKHQEETRKALLAKRK